MRPALRCCNSYPHDSRCSCRNVVTTVRIVAEYCTMVNTL